MKKSIYFIVAILMLSTTSYAQQTDNKSAAETKQAPTAEQIAKRNAERMKQQCLLGDEQYDKVYKLCLKKAEEQVARRNQMQKEQEQMNAEMKKILNETQYQRYEQHQKMPQQMGKRRGMQMNRCQFQPCGQRCPQMRRGNMMAPQSNMMAPQSNNMMQMPQRQLQKGQQIDMQTQQQTRRRIAMYDDTKKLDSKTQNSTAKSEQAEQK